MPSSYPASLRSAVLLLAAGAATHFASAAICTGTENTTSASMSCDGLVNSCTGSGLCVVGTGGKCCSVFTDAKDGDTDCVMKDLGGFPYTTDCPVGGFGIMAFCSGEEDMDDFSMSCGGLVDTCTGEGLCVVNEKGTCCSVYSDAESDASPTDCVAKTPPEGMVYSSTCNKGGVGTTVDDTSPPTVTASPSKVAQTISPTAAQTSSPSISPTTSPTTSPTKNPTTSSTAAPTSSPTISPTTSPTTRPTKTPTTSPVKLPLAPGPGSGLLPDLVLPSSGLRTCNEAIPTVYDNGGTIVPKEAILEVLNNFVTILVPPAGGPIDPNALAKQLIANLVEFSIRARKICTTCEEALASWEARKGDDSRSAEEVMPYCAAGKFASGRTISGIVIEPIDSLTGEVAWGKVPGALWPSFTQADPFDVTSEQWPANLTDINLFKMDISSVASAAAGAFSFIPDVLGNGEDWMNTRSYFVKEVYQASAIPLVLKVQSELANTPGTCTHLDDRFSVFGFSEGGYAAAAVANAMDNLGFINLTYVGIGAAPTRTSSAQLEALVQLIAGNFDQAAFLARTGNALSSTNIDTANTGLDQDVLSAEFMDDNNELKDVREWIKHGLSTEEMHALIPGFLPNSPEGKPTDIFNPAFVEMVTKSFASGNSDVCGSDFVTNETDKICEAFIENDLTQILESADYPVTFCHSPNDKTVFFSNLPNITKNSNLMMVEKRHAILTQFLSYEGDHYASLYECLFGFIFPFIESSESNELRKIYPMECAATKPPSISPTSAPTASPTTTAPTASPEEYFAAEPSSASARGRTTLVCTLVAILSVAAIV